MSIFIPVSSLIRLAFWLAVVGIVLGVLLGTDGGATTNTPNDMTNTVSSSTVAPAVEAAGDRH